MYASPAVVIFIWLLTMLASGYVAVERPMRTNRDINTALIAALSPFWGIIVALIIGLALNAIGVK